MNAPAQQKLLDDLPLDRSAYAHQYDVAGDQLLLVRLATKVQEEASFLDDRVLSPEIQGAWFPWTRMAPVFAKLAQKRPGYIFHMGHCGSTLISRLLSAATGAIGLREPLPLRALAFDMAEDDSAFLNAAAFGERFSFLECCWARGPAPVIVKATSICTDLAGKTQNGGSSALFLYQTPATHLAALLAGANSLNDLRGFAQMRHRRLLKRYEAPPLAGASLGELAAQLWLCEAGAAAAVHDETGMTLMNFENFLSAPKAELTKLCGVFGLMSDQEQIARALAGPILKTYSKAPEHAYSPDTRRQIIAEAAAKHGDEIQRGAAYIEAAGKKSEVMARAIELFSR